MTASGALQGKICLVLGASKGIGAATARAFGGAGATVVLASRGEGALNEVAEDIRAAGARALAVPADMGVEGQIVHLMARILETYGRLDVAFNNAGSGHFPASLADLEVADFDEAIRVSLRGTLMAMKYEIPPMLAQGRGAIVNMSSTAGLQGVRGMGAYAAAKHGIVGATKSAALDYAAKGIRINAVAPGPILNDRISSLPPDRREPIARAVPLGRIGTPEDVAAAVVWLASDAAAFVTGTVVPVDGGRLAGSASG
jgi:NAD(P)-dependent dehydrogenase (short-subunit alcohol dehydrogenase family)